MGVPILTRPEGRMLPELKALQSDGLSEVPILTRPEGRMLHPPHLAGRQSRQCSNPHPARRPDAARIPRPHRPLEDVPILTRPEGRMLRPLSQRSSVGILFQSSPGPKAGCCWIRFICIPQHAPCSNPHPARRPDAAGTMGVCLSPVPCSNPHPARRPDAASYLPIALIYQELFQSSPGPKAGCCFL